MGGNPRQEDPTSALSPTPTLPFLPSLLSSPLIPFLYSPSPLSCLFASALSALIFPSFSLAGMAKEGGVRGYIPTGRAADAIHCHDAPFDSAHCCPCVYVVYVCMPSIVLARVEEKKNIQGVVIQKQYSQIAVPEAGGRVVLRGTSDYKTAIQAR